MRSLFSYGIEKIKSEPKIIAYSAYLFILTALLDLILFIPGQLLSDNITADENAFAVRCALCGIMTVSYALGTVLEISFFYIIFSGEYKAKNMLCFLHPKYIQYNTALIFAFILPIRFVDCFVQGKFFMRDLPEISFFHENNVIFVFFMILKLVLGLILVLAVCFKAIYKDDTFSITLSRIRKFLKNNAALFIKFQISYEIIRTAAFLIMYIPLRRLNDISDIMYFILGNTGYGTNILFIPLYFICLNKMIES